MSAECRLTMDSTLTVNSEEARRAAGIMIAALSDQDLPWQQRPRNCADVDSRLFFPITERDEMAAKLICRGCPAINPCLEYALDRGELGIWGGTNENERDRLRRSRRN